MTRELAHVAGTAPASAGKEQERSPSLAGYRVPKPRRRGSMKMITTLAAAALVAGSATLALAQATGEGGASGAGADPSTPRQNMVRPTPNSPPAARRGDDMAPLQQSDVSNPAVNSNPTVKTKKPKAGRTYR